MLCAQLPLDQCWPLAIDTDLSLSQHHRHLRLHHHTAHVCEVTTHTACSDTHSEGGGGVVTSGAGYCHDYMYMSVCEVVRGEG